MGLMDNLKQLGDLKKMRDQAMVMQKKLAELARVPLADFMKIAAEKGVYVNYSIESLEKDFKAALKTKQK